MTAWPQSPTTGLRRTAAPLRAAASDGVVVLSPPPLGDPDEEGVLRGREHVRHLVRIARELPDAVR